MRKTTIVGALAVGALAVAGGAAFTNTNTVAASAAGTGTTLISAYTTSDVQYDANDTDPELLDGVTFTLDKAARYVAIETHDAGMWFTSDDVRLSAGTVDSCTSTDSITWTCDVTGATPQETVLAADNLTVVATT